VRLFRFTAVAPPLPTPSLTGIQAFLDSFGGFRKGVLQFPGASPGFPMFLFFPPPHLNRFFVIRFSAKRPVGEITCYSVM